MARTKGAQADQWWADAIRRVAAKEDDSDPQKRKKLIIVAHKLFDKAIEGDVQAMKEIGDRLDGRPRAAIEHSGEINHTHEQVKNDADAFESRIAGLVARSAEDDGASKPH